jgi:antitoxin component of RelBE/YafQ-DinJ toxin-antitoxin module
MGKFASEAKEATPMKFAKMTLRYKENTDGENIGEALYFLAQKLVEEADKELAVKLNNHDFSFKAKPVSCPVLLDSEKQNEFEKACKEKSLNAKELVNDFCDYVIKAENEVKKETVLTNFLDDFLKREDKSLIEDYQKICETEEVTVEQTVRALITNTVETGVFPFLFNRDEYTSYQDILKQLEITINQPIQMQTGQLSNLRK